MTVRNWMRAGFSLLITTAIGASIVECQDAGRSSVILFVDQSPKGSTYRLDGVPVPLDDLASRLSQAKQNNREPVRLSLLVHDGVTFSFVEELLRLLATAGYDEPRVFSYSADKRFMQQLRYFTPIALTNNLHFVSDVVVSTAADGNPVPVTIKTGGQNAWVTFTAKAGQTARVRVSANTITRTIVELLRPDGAEVTSLTSEARDFVLPARVLPLTGVYTIHVYPIGSNTGGMNIIVNTR